MTAQDKSQGKAITASKAADLLGVSPKTVSRWAQEGKLAYRKTLGGHRRYDDAYIRELADAGRFDPEDPRLEEGHS